MKARASFNYLCAALAIAVLAGCGKQDGSAILGQWHAERLDVMGLKLPIGPDLTISRDKLATQAGEMPITAIEQDGDEIVLDTTLGLGLTFHVVDADRIYIQFPLIDRIYYRKVKGLESNTPAAAEPRQPEVAARTPMPMPVTAPVAAPVAAAERAAEAPAALAYTPAYDAAVHAARQGQRDAALRYLHQAARQGFDRADILEQESGFEAMKSDPRYQVIVLNLRKR
jgi:hypothetical protein